MKAAVFSWSWANLPEELLDQIFSFLPSFVDRFSCAGVCSHWRSTAMQREHATPPRLPWLLRPSAAGASYFGLFSRTTTDVPAVPENAHGARFIGSYPGGWFFVARGQWRGYALLNLLTGEEITRLPDGVGGDGISEELQLGIKSSNLLILAAAVSPAVTPDGHYLVAAITLGHRKAVWWRSGSNLNHWKPAEPELQDELNSDIWRSVTNEELEDVIYMIYHHSEGFYFLTSQERLFVIDVHVVQLEDDNQFHIEGCFYFYEFPDHRMSSPPETGQKVAGRYLVESDESLLMVKRFSAPGRGTVSFQVFRLCWEDNEPYWQSFFLIGQLLFIGRGSSRAFQTGKPNPGYIYFLDDAEGFHDSWSIIRTDKQYRCSDAGWFSCSTSEVEKSWPQGSPPYSSPWVWLFH